MRIVKLNAPWRITFCGGPFLNAGCNFVVYDGIATDDVFLKCFVAQGSISDRR